MYIILEQICDVVTILGHTTDKELAEKFVENYLVPFKEDRHKILKSNEEKCIDYMKSNNLEAKYKDKSTQHKTPLFYKEYPVYWFFTTSSLDRSCKANLEYVPKIPCLQILESNEIK